VGRQTPNELLMSLTVSSSSLGPFSATSNRGTMRTLTGDVGGQVGGTESRLTGAGSSARRWLVAAAAVVLLVGCGADDAAKPGAGGAGGTSNPSSLVQRPVVETTGVPTTTTAATMAPPAVVATIAAPPAPTQPPITEPPAPTPAKASSSARSGGGSCHGGYINVDGNCVQSPTNASSAPAGATAKCRDGTYSFSQHRQGTCSGHGGVAQWL
jgi:hypothetical protein